MARAWTAARTTPRFPQPTDLGQDRECVFALAKVAEEGLKLGCGERAKKHVLLEVA